MNQKDKVLNLFGFLMDLIEEPTETTEEAKEEVKEVAKTDVKVLQNPALPHHPIMNPFTLSSLREADNKKSVEKVSKLKSAIPRSLELIKKMEIIDKERADEVMKTRMVKKAVRPLISEIEELKAKAHMAMMADKESEEVEDIMSTVGDKMGITLENGKVKLIDVPSKLRDNIPLDEETTDQPVGVSITKDNKESNELKGMDDLPKEVREKLEVKDSLKDSKLPQAVKEAILNAPSEQPITRPTEYTPELTNGEISYKPNNKDNNE